jgi:hypothetical protein
MPRPNGDVVSTAVSVQVKCYEEIDSYIVRWRNCLHVFNVIVYLVGAEEDTWA